MQPMHENPQYSERFLAFRQRRWELTGKGHATGGLCRACFRSRLRVWRHGGAQMLLEVVDDGGDGGFMHPGVARDQDIHDSTRER